MHFRSPFTPEQRKRALIVVRSVKANLASARRFPPKTRAERKLLHDYRSAAQDFVEALRVPDVKVSVARLNALLERITEILLAYAMLHLDPGDGT